MSALTNLKGDPVLASRKESNEYQHQRMFRNSSVPMLNSSTVPSKTYKTKRKKAHSKDKLIKRHQKERERQWITNFQIVCSRDNEDIPKYHRELFDRPLRYDVHGRRMYAFCSIQRLNRKVECTFKPKSPVVPSPRNTAQSNGIWGTLIRDAGRKISETETQKKVMELIRRIKSPDTKELEYVQIPKLRESSPLEKRMEKKWDGRCYRISTYNTHVHPYFRTLFEAIGKNNT